MAKPIAAPALLAAAEGGSFMSVDSTLLVATLVAFAIFAWILGKFAWGPLLKIVDERERTIRDQVDAAERAAADAKGLLAQHQELLRGAGREREEIFAKALAESERLRSELAGKARSDAEQIVARAREQMLHEKEQAVAAARAEVAEIAIEAAARIVKSSLSEEAQKKLVDDYIRELPRTRERA